MLVNVRLCILQTFVLKNTMILFGLYNCSDGNSIANLEMDVWKNWVWFSNQADDVFSNYCSID